jgi:hypothetical protein
MTGHSLTGSFNLPAGDKMCIKGFDPIGAESKLVSALRKTFHFAFLLLPVFCFLGL